MPSMSAIKSLRKLRPYLISDASTLSHGEKLRSFGAALVAILLVGGLSSIYIQGPGLVVLVASMGASAVLLFAVPHSPLAQPWPLVAGSVISAFVGVSCAKLIAEPGVAAAMAVALSILAMLMTHSLHPPGGAIAMTAVLGGEAVHAEGYLFVWEPVGVNVLLLLLAALLINNIVPGHRYPAHAQPKKDRKHHHDDLPPLSRQGLDRDDLRGALRDLDIYLDISEDDLVQVYERAGAHAFRRKMGNITCADIMSRDLVTAVYGTDLEETWARLRYHKVNAVPVVDGFMRVQGIVTMVDYLKRVDLKKYESLEDKLINLIRRTPGFSSDKPEVVGQIMASPVRTVRSDTHIVELVPLLSDEGLHHIPVVDEKNRLVGMVTQTDLIAALYAGRVQEECGQPGCG